MMKIDSTLLASIFGLTGTIFSPIVTEMVKKINSNNRLPFINMDRKQSIIGK